MARVLEGVQVQLRRVVAVKGDGHEDAVIAIHRGRSQRLVVHGHHALAVLSQRLGQKLLDPGAERAELTRQHQRHLVAPDLGQPGEGAAEPDRGIVAGAHRIAAGLDHGVSSIEQYLDVDAHQGRRHQAEEGQGGVATADGGGIEEGAAKARLGGDLVEGTAGVGDGHEVNARARDRGGLDLPAEVFVEGERLEGIA